MKGGYRPPVVTDLGVAIIEHSAILLRVQSASTPRRLEGGHFDHTLYAIPLNLAEELLRDLKVCVEQAKRHRR